MPKKTLLKQTVLCKITSNLASDKFPRDAKISS